MGNRILGLLAVAALVAACSKKEDVKADKGAGATATTSSDAGTHATNAVANANASADGGASSAADDVEPVYPIEPNAPADPLAQKLCETFNELPEKKRAACCQASPGIVFTSECTRMLSAALRHNAVELAASDVDACTAAFDERLAGCDWVGPFAPGPPAACMGIIKGKIAAGQKCRSSLECSGDLRCLGVGPTTAGKCGPAKATGDLCGGTTDTLAGYVRQSDLDKQHPECKSGDKCIKHKCAAPAVEGTSCQTTRDCADGLQCVPASGVTAKVGMPQKKCAARALPMEGESCSGGVCEGDLQCIKNKCTARKAAGESCSADFECLGGCVKGKCAARCDIR